MTATPHDCDGWDSCPNPAHRESEEPRYTLAEARREFARQECARHGHSWNIVQTIGGGPMRITCESCGWSGAVEMGERP